MRNALAKFGMAATYIKDAKPTRSKGVNPHWVIEVVSTDGQTRIVESDEADAIAAALDDLGEEHEARLVEVAAGIVRAKNRPTPWSLGP